MNVFRRMSTARLLVLAAVLAASTLVAGIALARGGSGPKPPRRPLAVAIHQALAAKPVQGISARITFTNHLFPSGALGTGTGSALLAGASGRLWAGDGRLRLELQSDSGDTQVMDDGDSLRIYDASANQEYVLPLRHDPTETAHRMPPTHGVPTVAAIQRWLEQLMHAASVTGAVPGDIAGRPVYSVRISPGHDGGLLGGLQLAWDAQHGVPLKVAIYSRGDSSPVLALAASDVHYGAIAASDLSVRPPSTVEVTTVTLPTPASSSHDAAGAPVTGLAAVRAKLGFPLAAPGSVAGLPRQAVRLVNTGGHDAAVVVYGRGLGAIAVLEQQADTAAGGRSTPLGALPRVSINGASGQELATALGTVLRFQRAGVSYTLVGSVPAVAAEAAARALA